MDRAKLEQAAEPLNQRGLTRFQLSQMLEEKTQQLKDVRSRLKNVIERKPRILPPVKVRVEGISGCDPRFVVFVDVVLLGLFYWESFMKPEDELAILWRFCRLNVYKVPSREIRDRLLCPSCCCFLQS